MERPPSILWPVPASFPSLAPAQVHVWCAWLDAPGSGDAAAVALLSPAERARAAAFHFAVDRHRYVASHAMLRQVLAGYLAGGLVSGPRAAQLEFVTGSSGKPGLADGTLQFNLSHSGSLALLAVARDQAVGIDLEQRVEMPDLALLEKRMFTPAALQRQQNLPPAARLDGFYRRWTELEAIGKCRGTGLELEKIIPGTEHLAPTDPAGGFTGCLACERTPALIGFFRYLRKVSSSLPEATASTTSILPGLPHRLEGCAPLSSA
jgi:4'-phosphopantetheinyl transferase